MRIMKALSLRQPWWWGIRHLGKDVENRDWQPSNPSLHVAGKLAVSNERFLIHTSKMMSRADWTQFRNTVSTLFDKGALKPEFDEAVGIVRAGGKAFDQVLVRGGIVGSARLTCVVHREGAHPLERGSAAARTSVAYSPWLFGDWGFGLTDVIDLPFKPLSGKQGFFEVDVDALGIEVPA